MKNALTFIVLLLFAAMSVCAQNVTYTYDDAGNRTARKAPSQLQQVSQAPPVSQEQQLTEEEKELTALPDLITEKDFSIYPNPTSGHFTVEINHLPHDMKGEAYLHDSNGRIIEKKSIHSHHLHKKLDFNISHKSAGMYILNIQLENSAFRWKIIKK